MDVDRFIRELHAKYLHNWAELLRSLSAATGDLAQDHYKALKELDADHAAQLRSYGFTVEGDGGPIQMEAHERKAS